MKTSDLVATLSTHPKVSTLARPTAAISLAVLISFIAVIALSLLLLGPRTDLSGNLAEFFHVALTLSIAGPATLIVRDLSVPGRKLKRCFILAGVPLLLLCIFAAHEIATSTLQAFHHRATQESWLTCLWQVSALAALAFGILLGSVRRLAPTDLRRTGMFIGMLAGSIGALGYCLHDQDGSAVFGATVYLAVIAAMTTLGSVLGPRVLRW